jgi:CRP/FNR family transcriptional regulator
MTRSVSARCATCPTARLCLARTLDHGQLDLLAATVGSADVYDAGEYIYRLGDATDRLHVVRSGAIRTIALTPSGEEHVTGFHFAGEIFGLMGFTTGAHDDSALALDKTSICRVRVSDLPQLWSIGCGNAFLMLIGEREKMLTRQRLLLCQTRAEARVAAFLLQTGELQGRRGGSTWELYLPMRLTDLANFLGMTLESLSRTMSRMTKAGLLTRQGTAVIVHRPDDLLAVADDWALSSS